MELEERIAAYLDGDLDPAGVRAVEEALVDPTVAALLSEELMLRALLGSMPPDGLPSTLVPRLESGLGVQQGWTEQAKRRVIAARPRPSDAVAAARWGLAGATAARSALSAAQAGLRWARVLRRPVPRAKPGPGSRRPQRGTLSSEGAERRRGISGLRAPIAALKAAAYPPWWRVARYVRRRVRWSY